MAAPAETKTNPAKTEGRPTRVFLVRRYGSISDSWSEHRGKTVEEAIDFARLKVADRASSAAEYDVVEVAEVRRVRVAAVVSAVDVTEVSS